MKTHHFLNYYLNSKKCIFEHIEFKYTILLSSCKSSVISHFHWDIISTCSHKIRIVNKWIKCKTWIDGGWGWWGQGPSWLDRCLDSPGIADWVDEILVLFSPVTFGGFYFLWEIFINKLGFLGSLLCDRYWKKSN